MRYVGKARLDARWGLVELAAFLAKVAIGGAAAIVGTIGWMLILQTILNGGR